MNGNYHRNNHENPLCSRCYAGHLKSWAELSEDEQLLAAKMPLSAEFTADERKRHLFCTRCWLEQTLQNANV